MGIMLFISLLALAASVACGPSKRDVDLILVPQFGWSAMKIMDASGHDSGPARKQQVVQERVRTYRPLPRAAIPVDMLIHSPCCCIDLCSTVPRMVPQAQELDAMLSSRKGRRANHRQPVAHLAHHWPSHPPRQRAYLSQGIQVRSRTFFSIEFHLFLLSPFSC
jgi:hypothetical protein